MVDFNFDFWAMQIVTGLALGCLFVLMAVGLTLIFGLLNIVNFAHGAFYMVGAFVGVTVANLVDNFWMALVLAPLVVGAMGLVVERLLVRPLYGRGIDYPLLLTFGLAYVLVEAIRMVFGTEGLAFGTPADLRGAVNLGFGYFPTYRLFVILLTAGLLLALWLFIEKTRFGLIIRAGARNSEIVQVLGVDIGKIWLLVFGLGTGLAALAGCLAAPIRVVMPEMGIPVLIEAFVVTVVGGMGSLTGAVAGGLLIGVVVSVTSAIAPEMANVSMFALMALVLLVRPQGLLGRPSGLG